MRSEPGRLIKAAKHRGVDGVHLDGVKRLVRIACDRAANEHEICAAFDPLIRLLEPPPCQNNDCAEFSRWQLCNCTAGRTPGRCAENRKHGERMVSAALQKYDRGKADAKAGAPCPYQLRPYVDAWDRGRMDALAGRSSTPKWNGRDVEWEGDGIVLHNLKREIQQMENRNHLQVDWTPHIDGAKARLEKLLKGGEAELQLVAGGPRQVPE